MWSDLVMSMDKRWCVESNKNGRQDFASEEEAKQFCEKLIKEGFRATYREKDFEDYMDDVAVRGQKMGYDWDENNPVIY